MKRVHNYIETENVGQRAGLPSPPRSPDLGGSRRRKGSESTKSAGTRKSRIGSNKARRDSHGDRGALKAQWERSFDGMSARQLAQLQLCREEGRDAFPDFAKLGTGVY